MLLAAYLTTAFVVGSVAAFHLLKERKRMGQPGAVPSPDAHEATRVMFSMAMWMAALVTPMQIFAGDMHGLNTLEHQPAKIAAMEGHFETRSGAPLLLPPPRSRLSSRSRRKCSVLRSTRQSRPGGMRSSAMQWASTSRAIAR